MPRRPGAQPSTYLTPRLGQASHVSNVDPTPAYGFGHCLTYTTFTWTDLAVDVPAAPTDGELRLHFTLTNTGDRAGSEVMQVYAHDPVASVVQLSREDPAAGGRPRPHRWRAAPARPW
ncbi:hypothetical protein ACTMS0_14025 [Micromonospora sp. H33]|uniref:hypothetical protein n=1 Tax=Micromonospora sp. H33 TaxID=3452215 RepID=UPI003F8868CA